MQEASPIEIVFENEDFAVLSKERGMPTAPLREGGYSLLTEFLKTHPVKEKVIGKKEIEHGLLHRLDTATTGLVLIAKKQTIFDFFSFMQEKGRIEKEYLAYCDIVKAKGLKNNTNIKGNNEVIEIKSAFLPCGKHRRKVKMSFMEELKTYSTRVILEAPLKDIFKKEGEKTAVKCRLNLGYRHQVRCHLASIGLPIQNDALYNPLYIEKNKDKIEDEIKAQSYNLELYATHLTFPSPYNPNEKLSFSLLPLDKKSQ